MSLPVEQRTNVILLQFGLVPGKSGVLVQKPIFEGTRMRYPLAKSRHRPRDPAGRRLSVN